MFNQPTADALLHRATFIHPSDDGVSDSGSYSMGLDVIQIMLAAFHLRAKRSITGRREKMQNIHHMPSLVEPYQRPKFTPGIP